MTTKQNTDGAKEEVGKTLKKKMAEISAKHSMRVSERLEVKRHGRIYKAEDSLILNLLATFKGRTFRVQ